jgi:hypothetical protein
MAAFSPSHIRHKRAGGIFWANGEGGLSALRKLCARCQGHPGTESPRAGLARERLAAFAVRSLCTIYEMESAMRRLFILATILGLAAFAPANAQNANSAGVAPSGSLSPTATPSAGASVGKQETNPAFSPHGPCSVSPNATGGVTTSSSCGTDPLEVPTRTLSSSSSPAQVSGGTTQSAQSSSGSSSSSASGGSSSGSRNTTASGGATAASSAGGGGGGPSSSSTVCSSLVPSTSGTVGAGSLTGGSGC